MIIRKPYAFLIKYFKIIHIFLFLAISYLLFKTRDIYIFYRDFLRNGTYTYVENMASQFINPFMIILTILLIGSFLAIYFLMKQKEKKVLYYLEAIIFYFLSLILLIYFINVLNQLENQTYTNQALVIFRDLSMVLYYANYYFIVIAFVRGFGFNVKKFNFDKDLKELDITEEDREEIELGKGLDYENVTDFLRRRKRNFSYYLKENSFILIVFFTIVILSLGGYFAINKYVLNKTYYEGDIIELGKMEYVINKSYITDKDYFGNIIKNNKKYLILDIGLNNLYEKDVKLNLENSRIKVGEKVYYSKNNLANKFLDLGDVYTNQTLKSNTNSNYILIYELEEYENAIFQLYQGKSVQNNETIYHYQDINLAPYTFFEKDLGEFTNEEISLDSTYFQNGKLLISSFSIINEDSYTYQKCNSENECQEYKKVIVPNGNNNLLKINYSGVSKNIFYYLNLKNKNQVIKYENIKNVTPDNYIENTVLFEIPSNISSEDLKLYFNIRGITFTIK